MYKVNFQKRSLLVISCLFIIFSLAVSLVPGTVLAKSGSPYETIITDESGRQITEAVFPLPPPKTKVAVAAVPKVHIAGASNILSNVPAFDWSYGCSATSAAMLFGYYDRTGYSNMYTGPTDGGVCPLDNSVWGHTVWPSVTCGECPLNATHNGTDGMTIKGHVDDYWIDYGRAGPDPYSGNWTEHELDCAGDYMGTNQAIYHNIDGGTTFFWYDNGDPLYDYTGSELDHYRDGCHGMKLFAESRGYTVVTNFTQLIKGAQGTEPGKGFTFADFQAEIDAGCPVLIQLYNPSIGGHTMLGYGYDTSDNTIYVHDTWDYSNYPMTWGGAFPYGSDSLQQIGVTVIRLQPCLSSIIVTPANPTIVAGHTQQFTATGTYSNSTTADLTANVTWSSDNDAVATIEAGGLAHTQQEGSAVITAAFDSVSGNTTITVGPVALESLAVTPAGPAVYAGHVLQFSANGTYSDSTTENLTAAVTWSSSDNTVARVDAAGLVTGCAAGSASITATLSGVSGNTTLTVLPVELCSIAVTPTDPAVDKGRTQQFSAKGTYSDSTTADLTANVTWSSSDNTVATIDDSGLAQTHEQGSAVITAALDTVSGNTTITVGPIVLESLAVAPANPAIYAGHVLQFSANGTYSDSTTENLTSAVTWSSSNITVATVNGTGLATGCAAGSANITATLSGVSGNTTLTVLPVERVLHCRHPVRPDHHRQSYAAVHRHGLLLR